MELQFHCRTSTNCKNIDAMAQNCSSAITSSTNNMATNEITLLWRMMQASWNSQIKNCVFSYYDLLEKQNNLVIGYHHTNNAQLTRHKPRKLEIKLIHTFTFMVQLVPILYFSLCYLGAAQRNVRCSCGLLNTEKIILFLWCGHVS